MSIARDVDFKASFRNRGGVFTVAESDVSTADGRADRVPKTA